MDQEGHASNRLHKKPLPNSLFDSLPHFVALIDIDGTILNLSASAAQHLGRNREEIIGLNAFDLPAASYNITLVKKSDVDQVIHDKEPLLLDITVLGDPLYDSFFPILDSNQEVLQIALAKRDVNGLALEKETGFETRDSFRTLVENSPDVICRFDRELRHLYINPAIIDATGLSPSVFLGRSNRDLGLPEQYVEFWEQTLREAFETGKVGVIEYTIMTPAGPRHFESRRVPEFDKNGNVGSVLSLHRDITDYRNTEEALRESESKYRRIVDTAQEGVWVLDAELETTFVNECLSEMLGYSSEQITGKSPFAFMDESEVTGAEEFFRRNDPAKKSHYLRFRQRDGGNLWTVVSITPITDNSSQQTGLLAMVADITRLKDAEETLRELNAELETKVAERTSQLYQLLGQLISIQEDERRRISQDLHDEVGQLMTSLILNLTSAKHSIPSENDSIRANIDNGVQIAVQTMNQLRQIAHLLHPPALDTMSLSKVIEGLCDSYARQGQLTISFFSQTDLPILPEIHSITLYRLAQEALTNIVKHSKARSVWVRLDCDDGIIRMSVEDNGTGFMPEAVSVGGGLQGLRERFHLLDGGLDIETHPDQGTCLSGYLPVEST